MTENVQYEKLKEIIKIYLPEDVSVDAITAESHFIDELNINSANLVDIILDCLLYTSPSPRDRG